MSGIFRLVGVVLAIWPGQPPRKRRPGPRSPASGRFPEERNCSSATASSITTTACPDLSAAGKGRRPRPQAGLSRHDGDDRRLRLDWHDVESYFRPDAIGAYSFDDHNNVVFNKPGKLFDAAVMMDCSQCPIHPTLKSAFTEYAKKDSDIVRAHGAMPVFFMSWAYADKPEMTAQLAEAYTVAGNANHAAGDSGGARARQGKAARAQSLCAGQAASDAPAPILPPARCSPR